MYALCRDTSGNRMQPRDGFKRVSGVETGMMCVLLQATLLQHTLTLFQTQRVGVGVGLFIYHRRLYLHVTASPLAQAFWKKA